MDGSIVARVLEAAVGTVDAAALGRARRLAEEAEARSVAPPGRPIVVLLGGTGSGKSSLLNALAGARLTETGLIRPTTESPVAWVPAEMDLATGRLLDELGILDRVATPPSPDWVVVDLPDTDSVRASNALVAEWLVPRADVVVWVTDPVKYHDARTAEMLAQLRPGLDGVVVALNKIDTLAAGDHAQVRAALADFVDDLGGSARVVSVAGDPPGGPPTGLDGLRTAVAEEVDRRAFDPVRHLRSMAVEIVRDAVPPTSSTLRPWHELEGAAERAAEGFLLPDQGTTAMEAFGRARAALDAGGASGTLLHRVLHGPPEVIEASALDEVGRALDAWRADPDAVALRASLEQALLGAGVSHDTAIDTVWDEAVRDGSEALSVEAAPWWPVTRVLGWGAPGTFLAGLVLLPFAVPWGLVVMLLGALLTLTVATVSLRAGRSAATRAWDGFRIEVLRSAREGLDEVVGRPYRAAAEPVLELREALAATEDDPYT